MAEVGAIMCKHCADHRFPVIRGDCFFLGSYTFHPIHSINVYQAQFFAIDANKGSAFLSGLVRFT